MLYVSIVWHVEPGTRYMPDLVVDEENISGLFDLIEVTPDIRHTLLVQADDSILSSTGMRAYLFERFGSELRELEAHGHEIGWHFHPIEMQGGRWQQSSDQVRICAAAEHAFNDINFAKPIAVCSTGWCYGSNELTTTYRNLGLRVDCSALPGLFHPGADASNRYGNLGRVQANYFVVLSKQHADRKTDVTSSGDGDFHLVAFLKPVTSSSTTSTFSASISTLSASYSSILLLRKRLVSATFSAIPCAVSR